VKVLFAVRICLPWIIVLCCLGLVGCRTAPKKIGAYTPPTSATDARSPHAVSQPARASDRHSEENAGVVTLQLKSQSTTTNNPITDVRPPSETSKKEADVDKQEMNSKSNASATNAANGRVGQASKAAARASVVSQTPLQIIVPLGVQSHRGQSTSLSLGQSGTDSTGDRTSGEQQSIKLSVAERKTLSRGDGDHSLYGASLVGGVTNQGSVTSTVSIWNELGTSAIDRIGQSDVKTNPLELSLGTSSDTGNQHEASVSTQLRIGQETNYPAIRPNPSKSILVDGLVQSAADVSTWRAQQMAKQAAEQKAREAEQEKLTQALHRFLFNNEVGKSE